MDNKKPFIITIIIMTVIIIGLGAYVVIDKVKENEFVDEENNNTKLNSDNDGSKL